MQNINICIYEKNCKTPQNFILSEKNPPDNLNEFFLNNKIE